MENIKENHKAIHVEEVCKSFGTHQVLNHINLQLDYGSICGLVGRNGSGKTVLMKSICGFMSVDKGTICVHGEVIGRDSEFAKDTGFIIENPAFLPYYSAYRNLAYLYSVKQKVDKERIEECLRLVGLDPKERKEVKNYSMGMKQRLGIAQAIMESPRLILVDEPFNGLDNKGVEEMRSLFLQLKEQGKAILLVSHNREDIDVLCDDVYEMDRGVLTKTR